MAIKFTTPVLAATVLTLSSLSSFAAPKPKLILQITVDQLRADLPNRYKANMGEGGFNYLYEQGVVYSNANHTHANTETIVGHASLATGAPPSAHGMIGNVWFDREQNRLVYNVEDAKYPLLSKNADVNKKTEIDPTQRKARSSGRSPSNIMVSTFSDELASFTANNAKIFAVSMKDRGAISMAAHKGKAFWFSKKTGEFVTSSYYYEKYPQWVKSWNNEKHYQRYHNKYWQLSQSPNSYLFTGKDKQEGEINFPGFGDTFPHHYGDKSSKYFTTFLTLSPAGDELTADFSKQIIVQEKLGQDDVTDYLSVSFSATDYVGHFFGPSSLEMEDNILQLDKTLTSLFSFVDKKVGLENTLIVLSADHGGADTVPFSQAQGLDANHANPHAWDKTSLNEKLSSLGIGEEVIASYQHPYMYLNKKLIEQKKLVQSEIVQLIVNELTKIPEIAYVISSTQIAKGEYQDSRVHRLVANNYHPARSGDIYIVFKPNYFINDMEGLLVASHHGSPWNYDTHVPIVIAGANIKPKQVNTAVSVTDIAPTLSTLIGAKLPSGSTSNVLPYISLGSQH